MQKVLSNMRQKESYLVFVPGQEQSPYFFELGPAAIQFALSVSGFVVEASHISRVTPEGIVAEEEKVHELRLEE